MSPGKRPSRNGKRPAKLTSTPRATSTNPNTIRSRPNPTISVYCWGNEPDCRLRTSCRQPSRASAACSLHARLLLRGRQVQRKTGAGSHGRSNVRGGLAAAARHAEVSARAHSWRRTDRHQLAGDARQPPRLGRLLLATRLHFVPHRSTRARPFAVAPNCQRSAADAPTLVGRGAFHRSRGETHLAASPQTHPVARHKRTERPPGRSRIRCFHL